MKTKPKTQPRTIKLRTVQSGIEAELRSIIKANLGNIDTPKELLLQRHKNAMTNVVPRFSHSEYRIALRDALKVVNAQFESYR